MKRGSPPVAAAVSSRETTGLRRWTTLAGIGLILLIVGADSYEAWVDYGRVVSDNERLQLALSRALGEQTARMIQETDVVLSDFAAWMQARGGATAEQSVRVARLKRTLGSLPFVASAALVGREGEWLASTHEEALPNLEGREIFAIPRASAADVLFVDRPAAASDRAPASFALSRRVLSRSGEFDGIVLARVAFDYLAGFYAGVNVTPHTSIRLLREDGVTLVHFPATADTDGARAAAVMPDLTDSNPVARRVQRGGSSYVIAEQKVRGYPIVIEVSRPFKSVLKPWVQEERSSAARTLSLAVLAAVLLWTLRMALNRHAFAEAERRRLEGELAAAQRVEALGWLAASVAHDFNNVLTAIVGYAELSRDMAESDPEISANLEHLLSATERARLLVNRVLTFDPHRRLTHRPTPVPPIVEEVVQQLQATLPANIALTVQRAPGDCAVVGDAAEIYQVLSNLCSNAVHAMPAGGALDIRLQVLEITYTRTLAIGALAPGRWVCVSISDTGSGLAADQLSSIFELFYTTRQPGQGTGIGLTVVRNIVLRMRGALDVESTLHVGTRMTAYWPAAGALEEAQLPLDTAATGAASAAGGLGTGESILVIDDERELVALTEELLASLSYEPVGFSDARAAVEAFRHDPARFDAILTDERMPSMRGLDVARQIHAINPAVPILMMTGHRDQQIDAQAAQAGIVAILDKPLRVHTLRDALARQFRRAHG